MPHDFYLTLRLVHSYKHFADTTDCHPIDPCARISMSHRRNSAAKHNDFDSLLLHRINYVKRPAKCIEKIMRQQVASVQCNDPEEGKLSENCG